MRRPALASLVLVCGLAAACAGATHPSAHTSPPHADPQTPATSPSAAPRVYPLTGVAVTSPQRAARPALSVKIDNVGDALPQSGLNQADLVTDVLVEGGLTRLMATYQSHDGPLIGPIRSARPVDADLLRELAGGIFAYSGAAPGEIAPSIDHSTALLISHDRDPRWFFLAPDRAAPHNVYSSTSRLYAAGHALRPKLSSPPQLFRYSSKVPHTAKAHSVRLAFSGVSSSAWTWTGHDYVRTQNGAPDRLADGSRITTTNVVVLSVTWHPTHIIDDAGNADPYVIVTGSGRAWVFRDGRVVRGRWTRPTYRAPVKITDPAGHVIALRPGRTWLELEPSAFAPAYR